MKRKRRLRVYKMIGSNDDSQLAGESLGERAKSVVSAIKLQSRIS